MEVDSTSFPQQHQQQSIVYMDPLFQVKLKSFITLIKSRLYCHSTPGDLKNNIKIRII